MLIAQFSLWIFHPVSLLCLDSALSHFSSIISSIIWTYGSSIFPNIKTSFGQHIRVKTKRIHQHSSPVHSHLQRLLTHWPNMSWDVSKDIVLFVKYLMVMLNIVQWCRLLGSQSSREWWLRTSLETAWWCLLTHSSLRRASPQIMLSSALPFGST